VEGRERQRKGNSIKSPFFLMLALRSLEKFSTNSSSEINFSLKFDAFLLHPFPTRAQTPAVIRKILNGKPIYVGHKSKIN
jgi:hypothetical protein